MTQRTWQLQEAKNKFSEVIDEALTHGPQVITRHGVETVVVVSYTEFRKRQLAQKKMSEFFRESPLVDAKVDLARDQGLARNRLDLGTTLMTQPLSPSLSQNNLL